MDHRGHHRPEPGHNSCRSKDREEQRRYHQQLVREQIPPSLSSRDRDRHWVYPEASYRAHFTNPHTRLDYYPYYAQQYHYGYPEQHRPQSRHGYDYLSHSHWDYSYDYYRAQHAQQDAVQCASQDSWRTDRYHDRANQQEHPGNAHTEEYRYDQGRDYSQHYLINQEDNPSRNNEEVSSYNLGTLASSKNSGLSSSSYELCQYINGAEQIEPVHSSDPDTGPVHRTSTPLKYAIPHVVASFGPAGQLVRVTPGLSTRENVRQVEIHSLEIIMSPTAEQLEMRAFPGPLTREDLHKVDAIEFAHQRACVCMRAEKLADKSSAALLWNLLILLCRQNGQIVGSDIAELLVQGSRSGGSWESDASMLIDFSEGSTAEAPPRTGHDLLTGNSSILCSETSEKALQSYTKLLLAGRKKEALNSAMGSGLWGHAYFLASKMDNTSYTTVLNRFTGQLTASDPLLTVFQMLSGRIPAVATCYGKEKWGDWRPHLAIMLSNETGDPAIQQKAIVTMGDTLASKGLLHAAHVCYLTASVPFGVFMQKADRLVLLGSSHRQCFEHFATNPAIQCTELYEYSQTLGGKFFSIPSFQVYKFLYASRLLDCGLASQAFHYCEVVGKAILRQKEPFFVLTGEVIKLSDRLRFSEGQFSEAGVDRAGQEPDWLQQLRVRYHSLEVEGYDCTATYHPLPDGSTLAHEDRKVCSESDVISHDIQSPERELYYQGAEDQEGCEHQAEGNNEDKTVLSWDSSQYWSHPSYTTPVRGVHATPRAASQAFSYHNTDSAAALPNCPLSGPPSAAEGDGLSSAAFTMGGQMLEVSLSQQSQQRSEVEASELNHEPQKKSAKAGWFSGWFRPKPEDVQKEEETPVKTELPPTTGFCPPLPSISSPGTFPSSAEINPFSRKAGLQPG